MFARSAEKPAHRLGLDQAVMEARYTYPEYISEEAALRISEQTDPDMAIPSSSVLPKGDWLRGPPIAGKGKARCNVDRVQNFSSSY